MRPLKITICFLCSISLILFPVKTYGTNFTNVVAQEQILTQVPVVIGQNVQVIAVPVTGLGVPYYYETQLTPEEIEEIEEIEPETIDEDGDWTFYTDDDLIVGATNHAKFLFAQNCEECHDKKVNAGKFTLMYNGEVLKLSDLDKKRTIKDIQTGKMPKNGGPLSAEEKQTMIDYLLNN